MFRTPIHKRKRHYSFGNYLTFGDRRQSLRSRKSYQYVRIPTHPMCRCAMIGLPGMGGRYN